MDILELLTEKEFLGREFLTWLWFRSETGEGRMDDGVDYELWLHDKISLCSGGNKKEAETVTCQGASPDLREARHALAEGKKVVQAKFLLIRQDEEWTFTLDSLWLNYKGFRTPKVMIDKKDPDGLFYEKMHLLNQPVEVIDHLFKVFLKLRISRDWPDRELPKLRKWIKEGVTPSI